MQHHMIVRLMWDTVYVIYGFIPISSMGMVSTVTGAVMKMGTHGIPMIHPNDTSHLLCGHSCPALPPGHRTSVTACPRLVYLSSVYLLTIHPLHSKLTCIRLSSLDCCASMLDRSFFLRHCIILVYSLDPAGHTRKTIASHLMVTRAGQTRFSQATVFAVGPTRHPSTSPLDLSFTHFSSMLINKGCVQG